VSLRREIAGRLADAGVPSPDSDAAALIAFVAGHRGFDPRLTPAQRDQLEWLVACRCERVPLQHLTGSAGFRYLDLAVGPGVFVPRPETEVLVDLALREEFSSAVDLCTGSGAIALALATETAARVWAVELDPAALAWARRNVGDRVELVEADVRQPLALPPVELVVSNPPYIPDDMIPRDPEVALHDPKLALFGGMDGLDIVRAVIERARELLLPGGRLLIEHGELQGAQVRALLVGFEDVATHQDLTGRDRVTCGRTRGQAGVESDH
jgi:release factor glutamine methyltransferase